MSAHPEAALPIRLTMDDSDSPSDVVDALFLGRFATGEQPFSHSSSIDRVKKGLTLLPPAAKVLRAARDDDRSATLAEGPGWTLLVSRWNRGADVTVTATSEELAEQVLKQATDGAEDEPEPQPENVTMGFWYVSPRRGPHRTTRQIAAGTWDEVRPNYTAPVADALDRLMKTTPDDIAGRLLLLHGPPGTGKTSALRTLARSWRDWCQVDCVLDPERLFNDVGYLMDIAIGEDDGSAAAHCRRTFSPRSPSIGAPTSCTSRPWTTRGTSRSSRPTPSMCRGTPTARPPCSATPRVTGPPTSSRPAPTATCTHTPSPATPRPPAPPPRSAHGSRTPPTATVGRGIRSPTAAVCAAA
ncbi:DUF5925 domain-containing protein [Streptomyces hundungensis]|uniref:DUF5925 domain-containing protein n=1 Tax=Streptomyces hundungensis TaxID=1077946 RepID=UPI0033FCE591